MITKYNKISLYYGIPGLLLQTVGILLGSNSTTPATAIVGFLLSLVGTILVTIGLGYYARSKARSFLWGFLGLMSWVGLLALAVLVKDHSGEEKGPFINTTQTKSR